MAQILLFPKKRYKFEHILICGCSHSAGSEIEGSGIGEGNYNRNHSFGAQLARRLGVDYTNIALPGASNDYINRATTMWILENIPLAKKTLFLIHWTGSTRSEIFVDKMNTGSYWDFVPYVSDKNVEHIHADHIAPIFPKEKQKSLTQLSRYLFDNEEHWEINRYLNIINLQTILELYEFPFIFRNAFQACATGIRYIDYFDKINTSRFAGFNDPKQSFFEHCLDAGFSIEGQQFWHHRIGAHEYWANHLYEQNFS